MTIRDMQKSIQQQLNAMDIPLESEDIETYINKAIDKFIKDRIEPRQNPIGLGFEQSQIRIDDLRAIIKESGALDTLEVSVPFEDSLFIDKAELPNDYFFLLHVSALIQYNQSGVVYTLSAGKRIVTGSDGTDYDTTKVRAKFVQLDDIQQVVEDPFNKMKIKTPIYTVNGDNIYIYTDDTFIVDKIYVTYIRQPAVVSLASSTDCDLAVSTHEDIVDLAVNLLLQDRGGRQVEQSQPSQ